jgi:hypothetical protein
MCNNIKLFKKYIELSEILIYKNENKYYRTKYNKYIRMIKHNCDCKSLDRFIEEQLNYEIKK